MLGHSGGEHPLNGDQIDSVSPATATEEVQEIRQTFTLRAEKRSKAGVPDMRAVPIATLMTGTGVVGLNEGRMHDAGHEHGGPLG